MCPHEVGGDLRVDLEEFRANAERYVDYARIGSTVVVESGGIPVALVVPPPQRRTHFPWGSLAGQIEIGPDFNEDLPPELIAAITQGPV